MPSEYQWLLEASGKSGDVQSLVTLAERLQTAGDIHTAAAAFDRAFGLDPTNSTLRQARKSLLDQLSLTEHGIAFRYVPAGTFLMGSEQGDVDERPVHPVELDHFWISETPISWACYCRLMDWEAPPVGVPKATPQPVKGIDKGAFHLAQLTKIRLQYCEDETTRARDWHAHLPAHDWKKGTGEVISSRTLFGDPQRADPSRPWGYDAKPMVCATLEGCRRALHETFVIRRRPIGAKPIL